MFSNVLKNEEQAIFKLRYLYKQYGYMPYKMSKFEEYDLYANNKDFLVSDKIITFNDNSGKLLALKPDVTLSIIKNGVDNGDKKKVYYNETVYRVTGDTKNFKEIMQTGLECIGNVTLYDIFESVYLSVKSLELIGSEYVLDLSHLGFITAILNGKNELFKKEIIKIASEKNVDEVKTVCEKYGYTDLISTITSLITLYGDTNYVLSGLEKICVTKALKKPYNELKALNKLLIASGISSKINFDFSLTGDINYYNGIVFKGYVKGIAESVLSGGQYDNLAKKISNVSGAVGFAVYIDLLSNLSSNKPNVDVNTLILVDEKTSKIKIVKTVEKLTKQGKSVSVLQTAGKLRYENLIDLRGEL